MSQSPRDGAVGEPALKTPKAPVFLACLVLGYIGIYLCRKNLAVAIPIIQADWGITKQEIGRVASLSTIAYAAGKFVFGPIIDRFGGRTCYLVSILFVALFGALGGTVSTLPLLTLVYSANRFAGSAAWGAMVKLVPEWFGSARLALAMAFLSLSFVFGGVFASLLAGYISSVTHQNWRAVMALPAAVLVGVLVVCALVLPKRSKSAPGGTSAGSDTTFRWSRLWQLGKIPQFWVVCALSFTLTLMRETFNTWTVDFLKTIGGVGLSNHAAAILSTPFDACGAAGILLLGWGFGPLSRRWRTWLLFGILMTLTVVLLALPSLFKVGTWLVTIGVGLVGLLVYGPYSLLAGVLSVEIRGKEYAATVAGYVDGSGYLAGYLAGEQFGQIVDHGGYEWGFRCLALLTFISAVLCLFLYVGKPDSPPPATASASAP